jgi:anaerobic magnesium-protoporphyrin IX monomethyl ester cyclase
LLHQDNQDSRPSDSPYRIALISLFVVGNNGVRFLAAALRTAGYEVYELYLKDFEYHHYAPPTERELELLLEILHKKHVDLVGISLRAGAFLPVAIDLTQRIREQMSIPVMWGGTHVTMAPDDCLEHPDFLVIGEADTVIVKIAETMKQGGDIATVDNVMLRRDGQLIRNPARHPDDLDALPLRDYHSTDFKFSIQRDRVTIGEPMLDERLYLMITSRGCLFRCAYCNVSHIRHLYQDCGNYFRYHSVEAVLQELEDAKKTFPKLKRIRFDDQIFIPDKKWIEDFATQYPKRVGLPFEVLSDPRIFDEWTFATLAKAGLDRTLSGVQAGEHANRRLYDRPVPDAKIIEMAQALKKYGILGSFQVIIDDPEATTSEKEELLELLLKIPRPFDLYIFSLCHWPSTTRTTRLLEKGLISPDDVEGRAGKAMKQFLADFSWPRPPEDNFFLALYQMSNKRLVPRSLVHRMSKSKWLRQHPAPLIATAKALSIAKFFTMGFAMLLRGEVSMSLVRRWLHVLFSPSI